MTRLRLSIGRVMGGIAVICGNFAIMRWGYQHGPLRTRIAFLVMPSATLLAIAVLRICRDLWRRGESGSFTFGYAVLGTIASAATTIALWDDRSFAAYLTFVLVPIDRLAMAIDSVDTAVATEALMDSFAVLSLAFPQVVPALLGGWAARRMGISVIVRGRTGRRSLPDAPDPC